MLHEWRVEREGGREGKGIIYRQADRPTWRNGRERHKEV